MCRIVICSKVYKLIDNNNYCCVFNKNFLFIIGVTLFKYYLCIDFFYRIYDTMLSAHTYRRWLVTAMILLLATVAWAQKTTTVRGVVLDSLSLTPLSNASILLIGSDTGTKSNNSGSFYITTQRDFSHVQVSLLGYRSAQKRVRIGRNNRIEVLLSPEAVPLDEVLVRPGKEKYSKKNNPAVDLARRLIAMRQARDTIEPPYFSQQKYEKTTFAFDNFNETMRHNPLFHNQPFLLAQVDTSDVTHKPILNLSLQERIIDYYSRRDPHAVREIVTAVNRAGLDGFIDQENMQAFAGEMFREIDIYSNDITLFDHQFVSPLSQYAISFYKYYLLDTLDIDGEQCIDLGFASYNSQSFGFAGHLYVVIEDSSYHIKRARYTIPRDINMNYVNRMILQQDYVQDSLGRPVKVYDDIVAEFALAEGMPGLYARRTLYYKHISHDEPHIQDIFAPGRREVVLESASQHDATYWQAHRPVPLRPQEDAVGEVARHLQEIPAVKWLSKISHTLFSGYIATHRLDKKSRFDIGPVNTFISGNSIEGLRLKVGGTTTAQLHPQLFASGYVGYGFDDRKWKYGAEVEYSFNKKRHSPMEYPIRSIKAFYNYDLNYLAQKYLHSSRDNFVLSLSRAPDYNATYMRTCGITYKHEFAGGLSLSIGLRNERQESTRFLPFKVRQPDGTIESLPSFAQTLGEIAISYSPVEKFLMSYGERQTLDSDALTVTLRHIFALKGVGSDYTYHHTEMAASKRIRMSKLGYADCILKAGKVWNDVPYPLLIVPYANMSYTIQPESFALLSPMEFLFDQYASWDLTYHANGLLFNRIPFINKLRLREVISFRGIYGTIRDTNYYPEQTGLFLFNPEWNVQRMSNMPYMEVGVGIDNILTMLRVEYVFRVTYRDTPGVDKGGVRVALHVTF